VCCQSTPKRRVYPLEITITIPLLRNTITPVVVGIPIPGRKLIPKRAINKPFKVDLISGPLSDHARYSEGMLVMHCTALHCTALHCTALHRPEQEAGDASYTPALQQTKGWSSALWTPDSMVVGPVDT
jgi:hypothetical protein